LRAVGHRVLGELDPPLAQWSASSPPCSSDTRVDYLCCSHPSSFA
jgi:hypothetical protein